MAAKVDRRLRGGLTIADPHASILVPALSLTTVTQLLRCGNGRIRLRPAAARSQVTWPHARSRAGAALQSPAYLRCRGAVYVDRERLEVRAVLLQAAIREHGLQCRVHPESDRRPL